MKAKLLPAIILFIACTHLQTIAQGGFTDKSEATNTITNGLKEGKWLFYMNDKYDTLTSSSGATFYVLEEFRHDRREGMLRQYTMDGKLWSESPYKNGKLNGTWKLYKDDGKLMVGENYADGVFIKAFSYDENGEPVKTDGEGGFSNKAEATNYVVEGHKWGKWIIYHDKDYKELTGPEGAESYTLVEYQNMGVVGIIREFFMNGQIRAYMPTVKGQVEGLVKQYNRSGKLYSEINYSEGKQNGLAREYYENGNLKAETTYVNDIPGEVKQYDEEGVQINQLVNGKKEGKWILYSDSNSKSVAGKEGAWSYSVIAYKDGSPEGVCKTYYINGTLKSEHTYSNGALNGPSKTYFHNGKINMDAFYTDGKPDGSIKQYNKSGKLSADVVYKNGLIISQKYYNKDGIQVVAEVEPGGFTDKAEAANSLKDGRKEGKWTMYMNAQSAFIKDSAGATYYVLVEFKGGNPFGTVRGYLLNGQLAFLVNYVAAVKSGVSINYSANGSIAEEAQFENGKMNGVEKIYYDDGKIKTLTEYINGVAGTTNNYDEAGNLVK